MSSRSEYKQLRARLLDPIANDDMLDTWLQMYVRINLPRKNVCAHHDAPFDYIRHAYFEPTKDVIVWAPRGGGKTKLAAVATMLDLLHKPPCSVRILGGSLEQSMKMWEHILPDMQYWARDLFTNMRSTARKVSLSIGSSAAVLTQSQRAVRGLRVQKLRCDEVELFDPDIWEAAQLATRSQGDVSGAIDALSTAHSPGGLMSRVIDNAKQHGTRVIRWCLLEVLEKCAPERDCKTCPLWDECKGVAKTQCSGFFRIDDAIAMKKRVSLETWKAEMLCERPVQQRSVFPAFDPGVHVRELPVNSCQLSDENWQPTTGNCSLSMDFGFAMPFVCLWIETRDDETTFVFDEYVQEQRTINEHIEQIESRPWKCSGGKIRRVTCDPAGAGRSDQTATSNIQILRQSGYAVHSRRSLIVPGLDIIRAALRPAHGDARLFIHPRCKRLIKAMQSYRYPDVGSELPLKDGVHDHLIDALRYHFVNNRKSDGAVERRY